VGIAGFDATPVEGTSFAEEDVHAVMQLMSMAWACLDTFAAGNTSIRKVTEFGVGMLPFGIVAPEALHGTTLEEHGCANARSIVQRETLNVENDICGVHYVTAQEGDREGEGRNRLHLQAANREQSLRRASSFIASQWFGTRFLTEIQAER